jgi:hypothetical protein
MSENVPVGLPLTRESSGGRIVKFAIISLMVGLTALALAGLAFGLLTLVRVLPPHAASRTIHESARTLPAASLIASTYGLTGVAVVFAAVIGMRSRNRTSRTHARK